MNKDHPLKSGQDYKDLAQGRACMFVLHTFILAFVLRRAETTRAGGALAVRAVGAAGTNPGWGNRTIQPKRWLWGFTLQNQEVKTDRLLKSC